MTSSFSRSSRFLSLFREIYNAAVQEIADEADSIRAELGELYLRLESGELDEQAFDARERELLDRLDEIEARGIVDVEDAIEDDEDEDDDDDDEDEVETKTMNTVSKKRPRRTTNSPESSNPPDRRADRPLRRRIRERAHDVHDDRPRDDPA